MGYQYVLACSMIHLAFSFAIGKVERGITLDARTGNERRAELAEAHENHSIPYFHTPFAMLPQFMARSTLMDRDAGLATIARIASSRDA